MKKSKILLAVALSLSPASPLLAQQVETAERGQARGLFPQPDSRYYNLRHKTSSLGLGGIRLNDEYLSPLGYGGFSLQYSQESSQLRYRYKPVDKPFLSSLIGTIPRQEDAQWMGQRHFILSLGRTSNPAGNASISHLEARLSGSRQYRLYGGDFGRLYLGPGYTIGTGGLYSSRNGNNPATFKFDTSLTLALSYSYRLPSERFPALLRISSRTDLLGLQWGQEFGESYYELYYLSKAWYKRLAVSYLGQSWGQELRLGVDLPLFDRTTYHLGYRWAYRSWRLHQLHNYREEHSLSIGLTHYIRPFSGRSWLRSELNALPF